jgi:sorbitol-specific phosphotransferase system component IIBC
VRRSLLVATAAVYAATYVALVLAFGQLSYGLVNIRVANVLVGLIPLIGWPAILGQALGVLLGNTVSTLGPIDLVNVLPSLAFSWVVWKLRKKSVFVGLTLYSLALAASVSYALSYVGFLTNPWYLGFAYVFAGIFAMTAVLGYVFYRAVDRLGILQRRYGEG